MAAKVRAGNPWIEKSRRLTAEERKKVRDEVFKVLEMRVDLKDVVSEVAENLGKDLAHLKGSAGVRYASTIAGLVIGRYVAMKIYETIQNSESSTEQKKK